MIITGIPRKNANRGLIFGCTVADFGDVILPCRNISLRYIRAYCADNYLLHLGRGTLRVMAQAQLAANKYFNWATEHYEYHYGGNPQGPQLHRAFLERFNQEVLNLSPTNLVAACQRPGLLSLPTPPGG